MQDANATVQLALKRGLQSRVAGTSQVFHQYIYQQNDIVSSFVATGVSG